MVSWFRFGARGDGQLWLQVGTEGVAGGAALCVGWQLSGVHCEQQWGAHGFPE